MPGRLQDTGIQRIVSSKHSLGQLLEMTRRALHGAAFMLRRQRSGSTLRSVSRVGMRADLPYDWYAFCIPSRVVDLPRMRLDE